MLFTNTCSNLHSPQSQADLIKMMEPDYVEIFNRLIGRGEYKNAIERVTWNAVGYSCRTQLSEKDAIARFKSEYKRQVELSKQPRTPQTHQVEHKKEVKPTDKMVDDCIDKHKGKNKRRNSTNACWFQIQHKNKKVSLLKCLTITSPFY